jgi:hypothetical protein
MLTEVQLTPEEMELHESITWDDTARISHDALRDQMERVAQLAGSLLEREAIPKVRLAYLTDPEMNLSNTNKSRQDIFEVNGTSGRAILEHPHFIKYLRYFIHGPQLPQSSIQGFSKIIEDDAGTSGMLLDQIKAFVRKEVRDKGLNPGDAAEEFFKLAHEIGAERWAETARNAGKTAR